MEPVAPVAAAAATDGANQDRTSLHQRGTPKKVGGSKTSIPNPVVDAPLGVPWGFLFVFAPVADAPMGVPLGPFAPP